MKTDSGSSTSVWMATAEMPRQPVLAEDRRADVCVIGAGISGLTTAYLLAREGRSVVVLDDGPIAGGETCRTTAHLVNALDDRYSELRKLHGEKGARLAADSHSARRGNGTPRASAPVHTIGSAICSEAMPPHAARKSPSSTCFSEAGAGE